MKFTGAVTVAVTLAAMVGLGACGQSTDGAGYALRSVQTSAGKMVVTGTGSTVYIYLPDPTQPSRSTCTADCANDWPPVLGDSAAPRVSGLDQARVGLVVRPDGARQLTFDGYPLYRFAGDRQPGDIRGESVGNTWFAIDPGGNFLPLPPATFDPTEGHAATPARVIPSPDGPVLADADGRTLYTFRDDTATTSACIPDWCVQDWPPLLVTMAPPSSISGMTARIGVLRRPDGTAQVTIAGHPVYRFAGDERPGDLHGLGVGSDWYPVTTSGAKVTLSGGIDGVHSPVGGAEFPKFASIAE